MRPGPAASSPQPDAAVWWKKAWERLLLALLLAAACAILIIPLNRQTSDRTTMLDFANFYTAGTILRRGQAARLYDLGLQREIEGQVSPGGPFRGYMHPPFEALPFAALAALSYPHAFLVWAAVNLLALGLIVYLLPLTGYRLSGGAYLVWLAVCLFFVLSALAMGQDILLLAVFFLLGFLALKRRWDFLAGLVLGLGLIRFQFMLPFIFIFFLRRRWNLLAGFCATGAAALLGSAAIVGWAGLGRYAQMLRHASGSAEALTGGRYGVVAMPTLRGAFEAVLGRVAPPAVVFVITLVATIALLGWTAWTFKNIAAPERRSFDLEFCLAGLAALLASFHTFNFELSPLIILGYLMLAQEVPQPGGRVRRKRWATGLLLLFLAIVIIGGIVHSQAFSVEVIVLFGMMYWLWKESLSSGSPGASGA